MPAFIALSTGVKNVVSDGVLLMTVVAMEFAEPLHLGAGRPSMAAASANPNWVGTKNAFVVTWLTKWNCHGGVFGKLPPTSVVAATVDALPVLLDELHAAMRAEAAAVALTRPVPVSS